MIFVERRVARFLKQPVSMRNAMSVIVSAMMVTVVAGGVAMRLLDPRDYHTLGDALWWALQTVTTVGYGDVPPKTPIGRTVASVLMIESVAFISVLTAAVTSSFVERIQVQRRTLEAVEDAADIEHLEARLSALTDHHW